MKIFSVYDKRAMEYGPLNVSVNESVAVRMFIGTMEKVPPHAKEDYVLRILGDFDEKTGEVKAEAIKDIEIRDAE